MAPSTRSDTILVVEDDLTIRETLGEILVTEGYAVVCVPDGAAALRCLRGGVQPSLILLDLMMPVMNGWEFRAEQLQDPELAEIPVVVVTGALRHPGSASGIEGAGLLTKPVDVPQLLETVARCSAGQSDWGSRDQSSR